MRTTTPTQALQVAPLPTAFLLLAENALVAGGHDPSQPAALQALVPLVAPVLTLENLTSRTRDLLAVAMDDERQVAVDADLRAIVERGHVTGDDYFMATGAMTEHGICIGLVAGYLLARMLDGKDGAR